MSELGNGLVEAPKTYTYTSKTEQVIVVTKVPTIFWVDGDGIERGKHYAAKVARHLHALVTEALGRTPPDEVTRVRWNPPPHPEATLGEKGGE